MHIFLRDNKFLSDNKECQILCRYSVSKEEIKDKLRQKKKKKESKREYFNQRRKTIKYQINVRIKRKKTKIERKK